MFAVLLALGLNSYKQSLDREEEAVKLKNSIIAECKKNKLKVDSILIKNEAYALYLDSLVSLDEEDIGAVAFKYDFELLTNAAWVIAQNNAAINDLDQDFLLEAAEIYHNQEFFKDFAQSFFSNLGKQVTEQHKIPPYNLALSLYFNVNVMNNSANQLIDRYEKILAKE